MPTIPGPVDANGNITVPAEGGVTIPVYEQDSSGNPVSIGNNPYRLFVRGRIQKFLDTHPSDPTAKMLVITEQEADHLPTSWTSFSVFDDSDPQVPVAVWIGKIRRAAL